MATHLIKIQLKETGITGLKTSLTLIKSVIKSLDKEVIKLDRSIARINKELRPLTIELRSLHRALDRLATIKARQGVSRSAVNSKQAIGGNLAPDSIFSAQQVDLLKNAIQKSNLFRFLGNLGGSNKAATIKNGMPPKLPPVIPPQPGPVIGPSTPINQWNKLRANLHKQAMLDHINRGNSTGAAASLRNMVSSLFPSLKGLMKMSALVPVVSSLIGPMLAVTAGVVAFGAGLASAVVNLAEFANQLTVFKKMSLNNTGPAKAIAAQTGQSLEDVIGRMNNEALPQILFKKLETLYSIENDLAALQYAKANELEAYLGLRELSKKQFDDLFNNKEPIGSNPMKTELNEIKREFEQMIDKLKELGIAFGGAFLAVNPLINALRLLNQIDNSVIEFLNNLLGGKDASKDKLDRAADKIDKAADKYLKAAGIYGGGTQLRKALQGVQFSPNDSSGTNIRNQLKALGDI